MSDPTQLFVVRHGVTAWNQQQKFLGHKDISLNKKGHKQASALAEFFDKYCIKKIYSSPLARALQTAAAVAELQEAEIAIEKNLEEIDFGEWESLNYNKVREKYPDLIQKWYEAPDSVKIPGGETLTEFKQRITSVFAKILKENRGEKIIIVTHGGVIKVWLTSWLEMPLSSVHKISIDSGNIVKVFYYKDFPVLKSLNKPIFNQKGE